MLTNPNTLGVFDPNIEEIAAIVHGVGRDALLRRREPQRDHGHAAPGRHGLRHRALQPAQVLHPAPRRRRPGLRPDRGRQTASSRTCRARGSCARRRRAFDLDDDGPRVDRPAARLPGQLRLLRALLRLHPLARRRGPEGRAETAVLNANYLLARLREPASPSSCRWPSGELCMHEFVLSGPPMKRSWHQDARPGQAPARPRLPPADGLLPAARRRGAAGRADRDRDPRDARRLRRGDRRDPARGRRGPRIAQNAPYTTPVRRLDEAGAAKRPVIRQPL